MPAGRKTQTGIQENPDNVSIGFILAAFSAVDEGAALIQWARAGGISFKFAWNLSPALWNGEEKTVYLDRASTREKLLGGLAHELRIARTCMDNPEIKAATRDFRTNFLLQRAIHADARSYELAMRLALQQRGMMSEISSSVSGLSGHCVKTYLGGKKLHLFVDSAKVELFLYARDFGKRYRSGPFSALARADAFAFFQNSQMFRNVYDGPVAWDAHLANAAGKNGSKEAFDAAAAPRVNATDCIARMSHCKTASDSIRYLLPCDVEEMNLRILRRLPASLQERVVAAPSAISAPRSKP